MILLDTFRNSLDLDIENFLRYKAVQYEDRGWCSTYIIVNFKKLGDICNFHIEGYFTLSNKVLQLADTVSNRTKKKLMNGIMSPNSYIHCILIGQLGKYIDTEHSEYSTITMECIIEHALKIVREVKERIVCTSVLVECRKSEVTDYDNEKKQREKLHQKYQDCGFFRLQEKDQFIQYVYSLKEHC